MQGATPRSQFQNMKYTNHQYITGVFIFLRRKLGITASYSTFSNWPELFGELGRLQEHELRGNSKLIQYHSKNNIKVVQKNLNVKLLESSSHHGRDQYCLITSDQVDKSKSTCLLRFRSLCGTDEWK